VHAIRVRPIGFNRDDRESFLDDQPLGDLSALEIKFIGSMRRFTQQNKPCVADK
jgi:hypothetical protein